MLNVSVSRISPGLKHAFLSHSVHVLQSCSLFLLDMKDVSDKILTGISCETNRPPTWCSLLLTSLNHPVCFVVCSRAEQIPPCLTSESSLPSPWGTPALSRKRYWAYKTSRYLYVWGFFPFVYLYVNVVVMFHNFTFWGLFYFKVLKFSISVVRIQS